MLATPFSVMLYARPPAAGMQEGVQDNAESNFACEETPYGEALLVPRHAFSLLFDAHPQVGFESIRLLNVSCPARVWLHKCQRRNPCSSGICHCIAIHSCPLVHDI
jgi:hypothetical protein